MGTVVERKYGHPRYYEILRAMADLHEAKAHDYSGEGDPLNNFLWAQRIGVTPTQSVMTRAADKWNRLVNLVRLDKQEGMVKDETFNDTAIDLAAYLILLVIVREETAAEAGPREQELGNG